MMASRNSVPEVILKPAGPRRGELTLIAAWRCVRGADLNDLSARMPLALLYLGAAAQRAGFEVRLRDVQLLERLAPTLTSPELIRWALADVSPLVGISCMSDLLPAVLLAAQDYKSGRSTSRLVLGGPGPASVGPALLAAFPFLDAVVAGEGEDTLVELLECDPKHWGQIQGLTTGCESSFVEARARKRRTDLDGLWPLPYSLLADLGYDTTWPVSTSRGCPYPCRFCSVAHLWGHQTTHHSVKATLTGLRQLAAGRPIRVAFVDDTFVLDRSRVIDVSRGLAGQEVDWHCNGRVNLMDEPLLDAMAAGGCRSVFYGLESGSSHVLRGVRKGFGADVAVHCLETTTHYMQATVSFIWGFPNETWEDFQQTLDLASHLAGQPRVQIQLHLLTPYLNVPLFAEYGSTLTFNQAMLGQLHAPINLTDEELALIRARPGLFPNFYHFPSPNLEAKQRAATELLAKLG